MKPQYSVSCVYIVSKEMMEEPSFKLDPAGSEHYCVFSELIPKEDPGGIWLAIMKKWLSSKSDYICYVPPYFDNKPDRFEKQIAFMQEYDLAASYGDVVHLDNNGSEKSWEVFPDFHLDMIGSTALSTETLLIDRKKFMSVGGFDYMLAGSYSPIVYLITMCAVAGRIKKKGDYLVKAHPKASDPMTRETEMSWLLREAKDMWDRLKLNKFAAQARKIHRDRRW